MFGMLHPSRSNLRRLSQGGHEAIFPKPRLDPIGTVSGLLRKTMPTVPKVPDRSTRPPRNNNDFHRGHILPLLAITGHTHRLDAQ